MDHFVQRGFQNYESDQPLVRLLAASHHLVPTVPDGRQEFHRHRAFRELVK